MICANIMSAKVNDGHIVKNLKRYRTDPQGDCLWMLNLNEIYRKYYFELILTYYFI